MKIIAALVISLLVKAMRTEFFKCQKDTICPFGTKETAKVCVPNYETPADTCARILKCTPCKDKQVYCYVCPGAEKLSSVSRDATCDDPFINGFSTDRDFIESDSVNILCWKSHTDRHFSGNIACRRGRWYKSWSEPWFPKCSRGRPRRLLDKETKKFREKRQLGYSTRRRSQSLIGRVSMATTLSPTRCPPTNCAEIRCTMGTEEKFDANGCSFCKCFNAFEVQNDPAESLCGLGFYDRTNPMCQRMYESKKTVSVSSIPESPPRFFSVNKPGKCPSPSPDVGYGVNDCDTRCRDDVDCRGETKCCNTGCALICMPPADTAETKCRDPGQIDNANRLQNNRLRKIHGASYTVGEELVYTCRNGFATMETGRIYGIIKCLSSGEWSPLNLHCKPVAKKHSTKSDDEVTTSPNPSVTTTRTADTKIKCIDPGQVDNGDRFNTDGSPSVGLQQFSVGQSLVYTCHQGFALQRRSFVTCLASGEWSFQKPYCTSMAVQNPVITTTTEWSPLRCCKYPGGIVNGLVAYIPPKQVRRGSSVCDVEEEEEYPVGSLLQYSCEDGFAVEGSGTLTCEGTGQWSSAPPTCVNEEPYTCENPGPILDGRVLYYPPPNIRGNSPGKSLDYDLDDLLEQSVLVYSCDEGYRLEGYPRLTCMSTGSWSAAVPTCVADCGRSYLKVENRVVNGSKTSFGDWPWMVSLSTERNGTSKYDCGGAVINSHTVITAAHCLGNGGTLMLRFGKHHFQNKDDDTEVIVLRSRQILIHPDYSRHTRFDSDIGLIKLARRIRFSVRVQPICLPNAQSSIRNIMTGRLGYVSGWGDTEMAMPPEEMKLASLPVVSRKVCQNFYQPHNLTITSNMFCAGYEDGRQSVCNGDSGSPFVFYDRRTERYTLEGLVSFGVRGQCGVAGKYAIFIKVSKFLEWILRNSQ